MNDFFEWIIINFRYQIYVYIINYIDWINYIDPVFVKQNYGMSTFAECLANDIALFAVGCRQVKIRIKWRSNVLLKEEWNGCVLKLSSAASIVRAVPPFEVWQGLKEKSTCSRLTNWSISPSTSWGVRNVEEGSMVFSRR